jgi:hypothetical protein
MLKHHIIRRSAVFLAAVPLAALTAMAAAAAASAGVNANAVQVVGNGDAGYSVTHSEPFANAGATLTPTPLALNVGTLSGMTNTGGIGLQLCDPNNGFGGQVGEVSTGSAMNVEFAYGTLAGAASDNCVGNPLLTNHAELHHTTLSGIPVTDTVDVFASFRNVRVPVWHPGHWAGKGRNRHWVPGHRTHKWQGRFKFQAQDETSGFEIYSSPWIHTAADWNLNEAGFGVQQDTNGLSADTPATCPNGTAAGISEAAGFFNPPLPNACPVHAGLPLYNGTTGPDGTGAHAALVSFTGAFVNGDGLTLPPCCGAPPFIFTSNIHEVATTGNGVHANPATTAPNNSFSGGPYSFGFTDYVGNVIS